MSDALYKQGQGSLLLTLHCSLFHCLLLLIVKISLSADAVEPFVSVMFSRFNVLEVLTKGTLQEYAPAKADNPVATVAQLAPPSNDKAMSTEPPAASGPT